MKVFGNCPPRGIYAHLDVLINNAGLLDSERIGR